MAAYVDSLAAGPIADLAQRSDLPLADARPAPHRPEPRRRPPPGDDGDAQRPAPHRRLGVEGQEGPDRVGVPGPARLHRVEADARRHGRQRVGEGVAAGGPEAPREGRAARAADGLSRGRAHRHRQDLPGAVLGRRARHPVRRLQELPGSLGRRHRIEPREDLFRPESYRTGAGLRRRSRPGRRQARGRRHGRGPLRPRLRDAREGDVGHAQPRSDSLGVRHVAARPPRGRSQAPGPPRRPHPALRAGDARRDAGAVPGHRPQAEVPAEGRRPAGARPDARGSAATRSRACWCAPSACGSWRPTPTGAEAAAARHPGRRARRGAARARTRASSNTWTSWRSRSAPISASCRRGSAT